MFHLYQSFREKKFQLTRSRGARRGEHCMVCGGKEFQLTRSRGARPDVFGRDSALSAFQLTRSRGARPDGISNLADRGISISTHALTWSATSMSWSGSPTQQLFQLTRSRGARPQNHHQKYIPAVRFQLTRSRGARPKQTEKSADEFEISTHALTWSATTSSTISKTEVKTFQLTRSRGARQAAKHCRPKQRNFNSRAHVERDTRLTAQRYKQPYFNSRAHVERDYHDQNHAACHSDFNSRAHVERDSCH